MIAARVNNRKNQAVDGGNMALQNLRALSEKVTIPLAKKLSWMSPLAITWLTLPVGLAAAVLMMLAGRDLYGALMLFGAALLLILASILDGFDGTLARQTGRVTRWGDYLDHTLDRVLDITWMVAIGYNMAWVGSATLAWSAAMATMFGSYLGTQAQAVTGSRDYGGFSRADRLTVTGVGLGIACLQILIGWSDFGSLPAPLEHVNLNPMSAILIISGIGGLWTFVKRFSQARNSIQQLDLNDPVSQISTPSEE